eukprot:scaffold108008_cov31-Tisochrysis_lutea.AAC.2
MWSPLATTSSAGFDGGIGKRKSAALGAGSTSFGELSCSLGDGVCRAVDDSNGIVEACMGTHAAREYVRAKLRRGCKAFMSNTSLGAAYTCTVLDQLSWGQASVAEGFGLSL